MTVKKKYHIVYKTTCLVNQKIYIGAHSTNKIDDGYLGAGRALIPDIKKYGRNMFIREILQICDNCEHKFEVEAKYVTLDFIKLDSNYNQRAGGLNPSGHHITEATRAKLSMLNTGSNNPGYGKKRSIETRKKLSKIRIGKNNPMYGTTASEATRKKMSNSHKGLIDGEKNPMYGKKFSKEHRAKISKALRQYYKNKS